MLDGLVKVFGLFDSVDVAPHCDPSVVVASDHRGQARGERGLAQKRANFRSRASLVSVEMSLLFLYSSEVSYTVPETSAN